MFKCVPRGNPAHVRIGLVEESGVLCPICFSFLHAWIWLMVPNHVSWWILIVTLCLQPWVCSSVLWPILTPTRKPEPQLHSGLTSWLPPTTARSLLSVVFRPGHGCSYVFAEGFSETIWHGQEVNEYLLRDSLSIKWDVMFVICQRF